MILYYGDITFMVVLRKPKGCGSEDPTVSVVDKKTERHIGDFEIAL